MMLHATRAAACSIMHMTTTTTTPKFIGRANGETGCACCGRTVRYMYLIDEGHGPAPFGRRCASRVMGWATSRVEMPAKQADRVAEFCRRESVISTEHPALGLAYAAFQSECRALRAAGYDPNGVRQSREAAIFQSAAITDWMWQDDQAWRRYVAEEVAAS